MTLVYDPVEHEAAFRNICAPETCKAVKASEHLGSWKDQLIRDGNGKALPILANAMIALRDAAEVAYAFTRATRTSAAQRGA